MTRGILAVGVAALLLTACTTTSDITTTAVVTTTANPTTTTAAPSSTTEPSAVETLDTQAAWVIDVLNGAVFGEADVGLRFSDILLAYVPAPSFVQVVAELRSSVSQDWTEGARTEVPNGAAIELDTESGPWLLSISVDDEGQIETLLLQPATPELADPPQSLDELVERLSAFGRVSVQVADVGSGTCQPVFASADDDVRPIGSTFKLYVLGAVADAVGRGDIAWDDEIEIRDELKSLPSGTFQTRPAGSVATVREFAAAMISASDNTATDHLMDLVGRDAVETALADYGNRYQDRNRPFPNTRELFVLKLTAPDAVVEAWLAGGEEERRTLLVEPIAGIEVTIDDAVGWVEPRLIDDIEWFADGTGQCRVLAGLMERANTPDIAEVRDILSTNPGVAYDPARWSYVGYKGGSEPGVLNLAWYLESVDGEAYTYVVNVTNPDTLLPDQQIVDLVSAGFSLIEG